VIATAKEFGRITIKDCVLSGGTSNYALVTLSNAARELLHNRGREVDTILNLRVQRSPIASSRV